MVLPPATRALLPMRLKPYRQVLSRAWMCPSKGWFTTSQGASSRYMGQRSASRTRAARIHPQPRTRLLSLPGRGMRPASFITHPDLAIADHSAGCLVLIEHLWFSLLRILHPPTTLKYSRILLTPLLNQNNCAIIKSIKN